MAGSFLLQDWTTVRGSLQSTVVTQPMSCCADLLDYKDLLVFLDVADYANVLFGTQTAPCADDALFRNMASPALLSSIGVTTFAFRYATANVPLARYVRWQVTGAGVGSWSLTFRVWLSPNRSGGTLRPPDLAIRLQAAHDARFREQPPLAAGAPHEVILAGFPD